MTPDRIKAHVVEQDQIDVFMNKFGRRISEIIPAMGSGAGQDGAAIDDRWIFDKWELDERQDGGTYLTIVYTRWCGDQEDYLQVSCPIEYTADSADWGEIAAVAKAKREAAEAKAITDAAERKALADRREYDRLRKQF